MKSIQTFKELIWSIIVKLNIEELSSKVSKFRQEDYSKTDYYFIKKIIKNITPSYSLTYMGHEQ